jgi:hypothetical protein
LTRLSDTLKDHKKGAHAMEQLLQMFKDFIEACEQSNPNKEFIINSLIAFLYEAKDLEEE